MLSWQLSNLRQESTSITLTEMRADRDLWSLYYAGSDGEGTDSDVWYRSCAQSDDQLTYILFSINVTLNIKVHVVKSAINYIMTSLYTSPVSPQQGTQVLEMDTLSILWPLLE